MMKTLFCILSLAFLLLGIGAVSHKNLQGFREESGISASCISLAALSPAASDSSVLSASPSDDALSSSRIFFTKSLTHYTGILTALSAPRTTTPTKTLKFNAIPTIIYLLSLQDSELSGSGWKNGFSDTNFLKYSHRYYIYTLGHILI